MLAEAKEPVPGGEGRASKAPLRLVKYKGYVPVEVPPPGRPGKKEVLQTNAIFTSRRRLCEVKKTHPLFACKHPTPTLLRLTGEGLALLDQETEAVVMSTPLHKVVFVAAVKRFVYLISRRPGGKFSCHCLKFRKAREAVECSTDLDSVATGLFCMGRSQSMGFLNGVMEDGQQEGLLSRAAAEHRFSSSLDLRRIGSGSPRKAPVRNSFFSLEDESTVDELRLSTPSLGGLHSAHGSLVDLTRSRLYPQDDSRASSRAASPTHSLSTASSLWSLDSRSGSTLDLRASSSSGLLDARRFSAASMSSVASVESITSLDSMAGWGEVHAQHPAMVPEAAAADGLAEEDSASAAPFCSLCAGDAAAPPDTRWIALKMCGHEFHVACMRRWRRTHNCCPDCSTPAPARSLAAQYVGMEVTTEPMEQPSAGFGFGPRGVAAGICKRLLVDARIRRVRVRVAGGAIKVTSPGAMDFDLDEEDDEILRSMPRLKIKRQLPKLVRVDHVDPTMLALTFLRSSNYQVHALTMPSQREAEHLYTSLAADVARHNASWCTFTPLEPNEVDE